MEHHLCFSGSPACSGINPCVACAEVQAERVLPAATSAAGLNGSLLALVHLFAQALHQIEQRYRIGVDPANLALSRVGVPLSTVFATPEDQVRAFHSAYREAWGRVVQSLGADPRVVRTPIGAPPQQGVASPVSEPDARSAVREAATVPAPAEESPAAPVPAPDLGATTREVVDTAAYEAFTSGLSARKRGASAVGAAATAPAIGADDIAAAGIPSATLPNGASH